MVLGRNRFGTVVVAVGVVLLLVGLLAVPVWAQETGGVPEPVVPGPDEECPGAEVVLTEPGTGDQQSAPFTVTGERFRVTLTSVPTESAQPEDVLISVDVINSANDELVTTISQDGAGTESSFVNVGPGEFFLDILSANAIYTITVEDCAGEGGNGNGGNGGGGDNGGAATDQYSQQQQVINVPSKPLPNTGGFPPLLAVGFFLVAGAGLGISILRRRF